jgi:hypothetical protein
MKHATESLGVDRTLALLARHLGEEIDEIVEVMLRRMRAEVPDYDVEARPELRDAERASCYGNVRAALHALGTDRSIPGPVPPEAVEEARLAARAGTPLESLLHTYRVGHAVCWERALEVAEKMGLQGDARSATLVIGSRYMFAYVDATCGAITKEYTRERDRAMRSQVQRRVQLVRDVLGGAVVGSAELGYELEAEHIGVIADGPGADAYLLALQRELGHHLLPIAVSETVVWGWLGARQSLGESGRRRLTAVPLEPDTRVALGEPGIGPAGFRRTHEQALAAHRVAVRTVQPLTRFDDVALEAALLTDERAARRLLERELGPLGGDEERTVTLCATLEAYLETGQNASAAAAMLGINDRTVAYRIRAIEDALGRSVPSRSAELAAALRLRRLLPPVGAPR